MHSAFVLWALLVAGLACAGCSGQDTEPLPAVGSDAAAPLSRLTAVRGENPGLFDALGRQVLLRGVNFNHLGDYFLADPALPNVAELGPDDWDDAAALGMSVIRLVTTWSAWEPERDRFDEAYLGRVRAAVAEAGARGMYVVIDMHQDAWSKFVFTPAGETCPEGTRHQIGWDGAPAWATFTDGEPTCTPGSREDSPAVRRAWDNFYANRDGIRDELAELWGRIAREFAADPVVAGYDLINEPGNASSGRNTREGLTAFYRSAIRAIRDAEADVGSPGHVIFFEPSVYAELPDFQLSEDPNLIFAPHNYFESIVQGFRGLLDLSFDVYAALGTLYETTLWIGEYGSFRSTDENEEWMARFAVLEDERPGAGGAWWQWEQECGDPHNVRGAWPPGPEWVERQRERCGNARFPVTKCAGRAYPRAVPGRLESLSVPSCEAALRLTGSTGERNTADLWTPAATDVPPGVEGDGILEVAHHRVPGGWRLAVTVEDDYSIQVEP
jgi:endoglycosylceramidase